MNNFSYYLLSIPDSFLHNGVKSLKIRSKSCFSITTTGKPTSNRMTNTNLKKITSNQIKSNHFYCHITTAQVPWWVKFLWACSRQCKKTTDNLPMDRQCKKTTNNLPMDRQCKKTTNNLHMDRQCKKTALEHLQCSRQCKKTTTAIYIWTDSAKKTTAIYIWTDSAKNNSNLHMDSTYLQTVQKTMCKIHIHILSTLSVL